MEIRGLTQREVAGAIGLNDTKFSLVMSGSRQLKAREADGIRRFFGFDLPEDIPATIAVVAEVGAGDHVTFCDAYEQGGGLYHIARPTWIPKENVVAAEVDGGSAEPWALDGDIIFWRRNALAVMHEDLGRPVVAKLKDGRFVLKRLSSGSKPGRWNLLSINPSHPNIVDAEVLWAARVLAPLPRDRAQIVSA